VESRGKNVNLGKVVGLHIKVGSNYLHPSISVRNLGLILDNTLGMEKKVNYLCKSCYYQIKNIGLIHKYINDEKWNHLVQILIISRVDYGNKSIKWNSTTVSKRSDRKIYTSKNIPI